MAYWHNGHEFEQTQGDGKPGMLYIVHGVAKSRTLYSDWTITILYLDYSSEFKTTFYKIYRNPY